MENGKEYVMGRGTKWFSQWKRSPTGMHRTGTIAECEPGVMPPGLEKTAALVTLEVTEPDGSVFKIMMDPADINIGWSEDPAAEAVVKTPVDSLQAIIGDRPPVTVDDVVAKVVKQESAVFGGRLTVVCLTMENGFLVTGESCCMDEEHFNERDGFAMALDRALEKAASYEVYLHRQAMHPTTPLPF